MAATDTTYRNQKALHIVFAISSIVMLVTIIGMFAEDYYRDWKVEQRSFRDVEEQMAIRMLLAATPSQKQVDDVISAEKALAEVKKKVEDARNSIVRTKGDLLSRKMRAETRQKNIKADVDSLASFVVKAADRDPEKGLESRSAQKLKKEFDEKSEEYRKISEEVEDLTAQYDSAAKEVNLPEYEADLKKAEAEHKKTLADFDRFVKLTSQKHWRGWKDGLLQMPVIDSFNSPTKIQQYTLDELPIDYSFKYVTRYDRCTTCHMGIDRAGYDKEVLVRLTEPVDKDLINRFKIAEDIINKRRTQAGEKDLPHPDKLRPKQLDLTPSRIGQFCSHPRQELFADANSPHPAERFGCTICHGGQGSATDFFQATHTPVDSAMKERWKKDYGWKSNHDWDFPMLPSRFVEASCVKCHHQVTDLVREGSKSEAPKLVKGYNLVRELGCFGCHEIAGLKSARKIGPDLRLEEDPPLDALTPIERVKKMSDPNPPGTMRKVGPSLMRVAEKTSEEWIRPWLKDPRGFRPNTKMPHFYQQANNDAAALAGTGQEKFPDTEIHAVAYFLKTRSDAFVADVAKYHALKGKPKPTQEEKDSLAGLEGRQEIRSSAAPIKGRPLPEAVPNADRGRMFFSEKGCLACHQHDATASDAKSADGKLKIPALVGESTFAPDLSRIALKLGTQFGKPETGRAWLIAWLLNPAGHSPRTLMPYTQLTANEADDIAAFLLGQKAEWKPVEIGAPEPETLKAMARIYLEKVMTKAEVKRVLDNGVSEERAKQLAANADELELAAPIDDNKLKLYVGKKAIGNMGCYACHSIPGFQTAKPIGTALNEWGKKDPDRLAFEDGAAFVKEHFNVVKSRDDAKDPAKPSADWKRDSKGHAPYEKYFADLLNHHGQTREGFLHLKLTEPRSYDHNRIRNWDERLRMPQFKFARTKPDPKETADQYEARALKEEAEGREAVMTFILGLVAEPVPAKYLNNPSGDRLAEVKGRQVLEKFNCYGCHILSPGVIDFKATDLKRFEDHPRARKPEVPYEGDDFVQPDHNAWTGTLSSRSDRVRVRGLIPPVKEEDEDPKIKLLWLSQAFRFQVGGKTRDIAAGETLAIPKDVILSDYPQFGGKFTELLPQYLMKKDPENYKKADDAFSAAPPTLINEGEKVQPDWLYQFLLNPKPIRPLTVLRMPKFNMSEEDAQALVNYFSAVDKTSNPGIGLVSPYVSIPQRDEDYLRQRSEEYVARLKAEGKYDEHKKEFQVYWEKALGEQAATAAGRVKVYDDMIKAAKTDAERDVAKKLKEPADLEAKKWKDKVDKKDITDLIKQWEEKEAYATDAQRLIANGNLCLSCHHAAGYDGKENKGPNLDNAGERLRPEWTRRWITAPTRYLHYNSIMPINFKASGKKEYQDAFLGTSEEQIRAARDFLMLYPHIRDWPILKARPILGMTTGGGS